MIAVRINGPSLPHRLLMFQSFALLLQIATLQVVVVVYFVVRMLLGF